MTKSPSQRDRERPHVPQIDPKGHPQSRSSYGAITSGDFTVACCLPTFPYNGLKLSKYAIPNEGDAKPSGVRRACEFK